MSQITSCTWDEENRLVGVVNPDLCAESFTDAGDGQWRSKSTLDDLIEYVWDGENVLQEVDGNTNQVKAHYTDYPGYWGGLTSLHTEGSAPSGTGAQFNTSTFGSAGFNQSSGSAGSGSFYYLFDLQSSTRYLTDEAGSISDQYLYRAFGEEVANTGETRNPHRFQGEVGPYTEADDRVWMRLRQYDPDTGAWISEDPLVFAAGDWNLYRFVSNGPVSLTDPWGLAVPAGVVLVGGVTVTVEILTVAAGLLGISIWACLASGKCLELAADIARGTPDLFPTPPSPRNDQPRKTQPDRNRSAPRRNRRRTRDSECKKNYSRYLHPNQLLGYPFASTTCDPAIRQAYQTMKDSCNASLRQGTKDRTTGGPCIGIGTHINVYYVSGKRAGDYAGAIVCCPTCRDTYPGVQLGCKCAIIWKRT